MKKKRENKTKSKKIRWFRKTTNWKYRRKCKKRKFKKGRIGLSMMWEHWLRKESYRKWKKVKTTDLKWMMILAMKMSKVNPLHLHKMMIICLRMKDPEPSPKLNKISKRKLFLSHREKKLCKYQIILLRKSLSSSESTLNRAFGS